MSDDEAAGDAGAGESRGQMLQRHKRELADVKKAIARLPAKRAKDEGGKMLEEVTTRQQAELAKLEAGGAAAAAPADGAAVAAVTSQLAAAAVKAADDDDEPAGAGGDRKPSKAQKRRAAKAREEAEREERNAAEKAALGDSAGTLEEMALLAKLAPLGLLLHEIKADGHCLYRSLEDQLAQQAAAAPARHDFQSLRALAAAYVREHEAEYRPFIDDCADDTPEAAAGFQRYCDEMERTATWGGQLELGALAHALRRPIRVYSAHLPEVAMGEEYAGEPLRVAYLQHAYGLGEHYNSVRAIPS